MTKQIRYALTIVWKTGNEMETYDDLLTLADVKIRVADELTNQAVAEVIVTKVVTTKTIVKRVKQK